MTRVRLAILLLLFIVLTNSKWVHKTYDVSGFILASPVADSTGNFRSIILPPGSSLTVPVEIPTTPAKDKT